MSEPIRKVAFGYRMGVGKDTAADYLQNVLGGKRMSFAEPIYDILHYAQDRCGIPRCKDRQFLQYVGTNWGRKQNKNMWIDLVLKNTPENEYVFLSDLRFPNELKALRENGWYCVKLVRDHDTAREGTGSSTHSSETALDSVPNSQWNAVIYNNGSLTEFLFQLDGLISQIKSRE